MLFDSKEERIKAYTYLLNEYNAYGIDDCILVQDLDKMGFFTAPASRHFHGAYEGGLFDHSYTVAKELADLTKRLNLHWEFTSSPVIVGFYHDLCKCDLYKLVDGIYEFNPEADEEHGIKSVKICKNFLNITKEEINCIRYHMGAYELDDWKNFDIAISKYPNVLYTHMADMIASKIDNY